MAGSQYQTMSSGGLPGLGAGGWSNGGLSTMTGVQPGMWGNGQGVEQGAPASYSPGAVAQPPQYQTSDPTASGGGVPSWMGDLGNVIGGAANIYGGVQNMNNQNNLAGAVKQGYGMAGGAYNPTMFGMNGVGGSGFSVSSPTNGQPGSINSSLGAFNPLYGQYAGAASNYLGQSQGLAGTAASGAQGAYQSALSSILPQLQQMQGNLLSANNNGLFQRGQLGSGSFGQNTAGGPNQAINLTTQSLGSGFAQQDLNAITQAQNQGLNFFNSNLSGANTLGNLGMGATNSGMGLIAGQNALAQNPLAYSSLYGNQQIGATNAMANTIHAGNFQGQAPASGTAGFAQQFLGQGANGQNGLIGGIGAIAKGIGGLFGGGSSGGGDGSGGDSSNAPGTYGYGDTGANGQYNGGAFNGGAPSYDPNQNYSQPDPNAGGAGTDSGVPDWLNFKGAGGQAAGSGGGSGGGGGPGGYSSYGSPDMGGVAPPGNIAATDPDVAALGGSIPGLSPPSGSSLGSVGGMAGAAGNVAGILSGIQKGGVTGNVSAALNAGSLAGKAGAYGGASAGVGGALGAAGGVLGVYNGIQQGGVQGYTSAAVSAASAYAGASQAMAAAGYGSLAGAGAAGAIASALGPVGVMYALGSMASAADYKANAYSVTDPTTGRVIQGNGHDQGGGVGYDSFGMKVNGISGQQQLNNEYAIGKIVGNTSGQDLSASQINQLRNMGGTQAGYGGTATGGFQNMTDDQIRQYFHTTASGQGQGSGGTH